MRYDGNLAYKTDYTETAYIRKRERVMQVKKQAQKKVRKKAVNPAIIEKRRRIMQLLIRTFCVMIICVSASFMITKYVQLDALDREAKSLRNEVETMRSSTSQKIIEMEQGIDLAYIEAQATGKLNMKRPEKYQQIYVDVKRDDLTGVTAREAESFKTLMKEFFDKVTSNIVDHFSIR